MSAHVEVFEAERGAMVALAYRMLGSRAEAEDIAQDAFLRWRTAGEVENPHAWLATVVTRLCLDRMKSAKAQREIYVGPWLPEPIVDETLSAPGGSLELAEDLSMTLMLTLERLSPLERAAFLLHDVFDLGFAEVARGLNRSEEACRRLASRARNHVRESRPRYPVSPEAGRKLVEAFLRAAELGDLAGLASMLAADAILWADGGGKRPAALSPIEGREAITRFVDGITHRPGGLNEAQSRPACVNGLAGLVLRHPDGDISTVAFEIDEELIRAIYFVRNPDKLTRVSF